MRQHEEQLSALNISVCVVTFEAGPVAMAYVRETGLEWPLLVDSDRRLYRAYGMDRGSWGKIFGPAAVASYVKLLAQGRRLQSPGSDVYQLGGDVLIDPDGIVRVHHVGLGPADRPAVRELVAPART